MAREDFAVISEPDQERYVLVDRSVPKEIGEADYVDAAFDGSNQRIIYSTFVSDDYKGQGLGSLMVREVVEQSIVEGFEVVPVCPFVVSWLQKHPEYQEHVVEASDKHLELVPEIQH